MIKIESEEDLSVLKNRLYKACEKRGIRLGKKESRINEITAEMLGFQDWNTCIAYFRAKAKKS